MTTSGNQMSKSAVRQTNPMVQTAADQVRRSRNRPARQKAKDVPRTPHRDQLSLFDTSEVTE